MQGCFGGFWRRRVRLTGWQGGFRVTGCRCAGRLWCTGWRVRILWCRSIFAGGGRGGGKPLSFFAGWVFAICCGCIWKKNTESQAFQACSWLEHALAPRRRAFVAATRRSRLRRVCVVCVLFPNTSAGLRTLPSPNAEPVPSLFIPSQNQYYNQRRESRQEKPLLSLFAFFVCFSLLQKGENQND